MHCDIIVYKKMFKILEIIMFDYTIQTCIIH